MIKKRKYKLINIMHKINVIQKRAFFIMFLYICKYISTHQVTFLLPNTLIIIIIIITSFYIALFQSH